MPTGSPFYTSAEEMQDAIKGYFDNCPRKRTIYVKVGKDEYIPVEVSQPTITGLALHLGFCSRQSLYDYEDKPDFSYTVKKARLFIEREYEEQLLINPTGAIFALKNFGWTDKQTIDQNTNFSASDTITSLIDNIGK